MTTTRGGGRVRPGRRSPAARAACAPGGVRRGRPCRTRPAPSAAGRTVRPLRAERFDDAARTASCTSAGAVSQPARRSSATVGRARLALAASSVRQARGVGGEPGEQQAAQGRRDRPADPTRSRPVMRLSSASARDSSRAAYEFPPEIACSRASTGRGHAGPLLPARAARRPPARPSTARPAPSRAPGHSASALPLPAPAGAVRVRQAAIAASGSRRARRATNASALRARGGSSHCASSRTSSTGKCSHSAVSVSWCLAARSVRTSSVRPLVPRRRLVLRPDRCSAARAATCSRGGGVARTWSPTSENRSIIPRKGRCRSPSRSQRRARGR